MRAVCGPWLLVGLFGIGCAGAVPRDPACIEAQACDEALEEPTGDFAEDNPTFGDEGTCWLSATTAPPCQKACSDFLVEQQLAGLDRGNTGIVVACGGSVDP